MNYLTFLLENVIIIMLNERIPHRQAVRQRALTPSAKVRILVGKLKDITATLYFECVTIFYAPEECLELLPSRQAGKGNCL